MRLAWKYLFQSDTHLRSPDCVHQVSAMDIQSSVNVIGTTLTNGIQDISALLPLLGSEQCENHVASAMTSGYLYVAATPMSIFGSLGIVRAGFKALVAGVDISVPFWSIIGARGLHDAGFEPKGDNLPLIMADPNEKSSHLAESRLSTLLKDQLKIDDVNKVTVSIDCLDWNVKMFGLTALFCSLSIAPYIYLNTWSGSQLPPFVRWAFPITRALGSFLTATMIQIVIQRRFIVLMRDHPIFMAADAIINSEMEKDTHQDFSWDTYKTHKLLLRKLKKWVEAKLKEDTEKGHQTVKVQDLHILLNTRTEHPLIWPFLILLLLGCIGSVVGYVGCFSVVQSSRNGTGPIIWLACEAALSLIRMILWGWNPADEPNPITITFPHIQTLPTCKEFSNEIGAGKLLPIIQHQEFLPTLTLCTGLAKKLDYPNISLWYTLTHHDSSNETWSRNHPNPPLDSMLYITVFEHVERVYRVFHWSSGDGPRKYVLYDADRAPLSSSKDGIMIQLKNITSEKNDTIWKNTILVDQLKSHYQDILNLLHIQSRSDQETITSDWTFITNDPKLYTHIGRRITPDAPEYKLGHTSSFVEYRKLQQTKQALCQKRGLWIEQYMSQLQHEAELELQEFAPESEQYKEEKLEVEILFVEEYGGIEHLFIEESSAWEHRLLSRQVMKDAIQTGYGMRLGPQEMQEWVNNQWRNAYMRLTKERARMYQRLKRVKDQQPTWAQSSKDQKQVEKQWKMLIDSIDGSWKKWLELTKGMKGKITSPTSQTRLKGLESWLEPGSKRMIGRIQNDNKEEPKYSNIAGRCALRRKHMEDRLYGELQDIEDRLQQELKACNNKFQYYKDIAKLAVISRNWQIINQTQFQTQNDFERLEAISRAVLRNKRVSCLVFSASEQLSELIKVTFLTKSTTIIRPTDSLLVRELELEALFKGVRSDYTQITRIQTRERKAIKNALEEHGLQVESSEVIRKSKFGNVENTICQVMFKGPAMGSLVLRVSHHLQELEDVATSFEVIALEKKHSLEKLPGGHQQYIKLSPDVHFSPRQQNQILLTYSEGSKSFPFIRDVMLLNEQGLHYEPEADQTLPESNVNDVA